MDQSQTYIQNVPQPNSNAASASGYDVKQLERRATPIKSERRIFSRKLAIMQESNM